MQTVFCREGDWVQLPLRVIRKINGRKVFAWAICIYARSIIEDVSEQK